MLAFHETQLIQTRRADLDVSLPTLHLGHGESAFVKLAEDVSAGARGCGHKNCVAGTIQGRQTVPTSLSTKTP
jgi:hypothetical protein